MSNKNRVDLCLVEMRVVKFKAENPPGSLFSCPYCGLIDTKEIADWHVWDAKKPLLWRLDFIDTPVSRVGLIDG